MRQFDVHVYLDHMSDVSLRW